MKNSRRSRNLLVIILFLTIFCVVYYLNEKRHSRPEYAANKFFKWYLGDIYSKITDTPDIVQDVSGVFRLDSSKNFELLKHSGYFSDTFFKNQRSRYDWCENALAHVEAKKVSECDCSPVEFVSGDACEFLTHDDWVGGQGEDLVSADVVSVETKDGKSQVVMGVNSKDHRFSYVLLSLEFVQGKWLVANIEHKFTVPSAEQIYWINENAPLLIK